MTLIHEIRRDLLLYLKQNSRKGTMIYTSSPENFPKVKKTSPPQKPKITVPPPAPPKKVELEEVFSPPAPKDSFEIEKGEIEKREFSSDLHSFYEKMALQLHQKKTTQQPFSEVAIFSDPSLGGSLQLLQNLAHAINTKFSPCRLLDISWLQEGNSCESFRLLLIPDHLLSHFPKLQNDRCIILKELDQMQHSAEKKKALWESITSSLKS